MTEDEVAAMLQRACDDAGSYAAWASRRGIRVTYAMRVAKGEMRPGKAITNALGLERVVSHQPATRRRGC